MEEQFPRARNAETGGTKMILVRLASCHASPSRKRGAQKSYHTLKKISPRQPAAKDPRVSRAQDRFGRQKNSPNTAATRFLSRWRNGRGNTTEIGASVTTSHLLLQPQPGSTVALLRITRPNSDFPGHKRHENPRGGGGGGLSQSNRTKVLYR
jgi:hypothetical protein